MIKKLLFMGLSGLLLIGCSGDPVVKDLSQYVQQDLFNLETNRRAAQSQYLSVKGDTEKKQVSIIKSKVTLQLEKYLKGLKDTKPKTTQVQELNKEGIQRVEKALDLVNAYRKTLMKRDSHQVPIARSELDTAFREIEEWKNEVYLLAREKNISIPSERVK